MVDKTGAWFGDRSVPRGSNDHVNWNVHRDYVCHAAVVSLHGPQDPFSSLELKNKNNTIPYTFYNFVRKHKHFIQLLQFILTATYNPLGPL